MLGLMGKVGIVLGSGIGDAVQMLPLVKQLVSDGYSVQMLNYGQWGGHVFYDLLHLPALKVLNFYGDSKASWWHYIQAFDIIYVDRTSASKINILRAALLGKKIKVLRSSRMKNIAHIDFVPTKPDVHFLIQNLGLYKPVDNIDLDRTFYCTINSEKGIAKFDLPDKYIVFQPGAANMKVLYKSWPVEFWVKFLKRCSREWPGCTFVMIGDHHETNLGLSIGTLCENVINLIGKTTLQEAIFLVESACLYLGQDTGLMHISAALKKYTFTIWGGSDYNTVGYQCVNENLHQDVFAQVACSPCYSLLNPNRMRVRDAKKCPDNRCLTLLSPEYVFGAFKSFIERNKLNVDD